METGDFHWTEGWYFKRLADGDVRVRHQHSMERGDDVYFVVPAAEWCSIIGHLSAKGASLPGEAYADACVLHGGKKKDDTGRPVPPHGSGP